MIKIDLITGFLGSGKTTFLRNYAEYLMRQGHHVGIVENDFGAVNVDMLLLQDLEGEKCELEPIVGGNEASDWKRRFKAKLILFALEGVDRVLVEPSGIYDVDTFKEILYDDSVSLKYEIGNIYMILDARLDERLSEQAEYLLVSQAASCGQVILSKSDGVTEEEKNNTISHLSELLKKYDCDRKIEKDIFSKKWNEMRDEDYRLLMECGFTDASYKRLVFDKNQLFTSLFFMNCRFEEQNIENSVRRMFEDPACGQIFRIKGFFQEDSGRWMEINATREHMEMKPLDRGQEVVIVIGEHLDRAVLEAYFKTGRKTDVADR